MAQISMGSGEWTSIEGGHGINVGRPVCLDRNKSSIVQMALAIGIWDHLMLSFIPNKQKTNRDFPSPSIGTFPTCP